MLSAKHLDFCFCESKIFIQVFLGNHGIFIKIIDGRMLSVFFYRENAGHIGQFHIILTLEKPAQEIQVIFLDILPLPGNPEYAVPFIDNKNKSFFCLGKYLPQAFFQPDVWPCVRIIRKQGLQL